MIDNPKFQGKEYSWKDVKVFMNGKELGGIQSINLKGKYIWPHTIEVDEIVETKMTEEQLKAKELYDKYWKYCRENELESCVNDMKWHVVNLCELAIDEIISACEYNNVESYNTDWWNKVRQELQNL